MDVTAQVTAKTGWSAGTLNPGESRDLRIEVEPRADIPQDSEAEILVTAFPVADPLTKDAVLAIAALKPDISVGLSIASNPAAVGAPITASLTIHRAGWTPGFRVDLFRDRNAAPGQGVQGDQFFTVEAGSDTLTRQMQFTQTKSGNCATWVYVDSDNVVAEMDEDNNLASATYTVGGMSISGKVTNSSGQPLPGVTVTALSSGATITVRSATTDAQGNYLISGLSPLRYTVAAAKPRYTFDPPSAAVILTATNANATNVNFTATDMDLAITIIISPASGPVGSDITATKQPPSETATHGRR